MVINFFFFTNSAFPQYNFREIKNAEIERGIQYNLIFGKFRFSAKKIPQNKNAEIERGIPQNLFFWKFRFSAKKIPQNKNAEIERGIPRRKFFQDFRISAKKFPFSAFRFPRFSNGLYFMPNFIIKKFKLKNIWICVRIVS